jgi:hypothetical protein
MTTYTVKVQTGDVDDAGTDAKVYITLYGRNGSSGERHLEESQEHPKDPFEKGYLDTFTLDNEDLGDLHCINIRHDNSGHKPGWFLEHIIVNKWDFHCHRWLAKDGDDKLTSRGLAESRFYV